MDGGNVYFSSPAAPDLERYRSYIADLNLPREEETELLLVIYRMMGSFVNRAWGDDPVQHVHEIRARDEKAIPPMVSSAQVHQNDPASLSSAFTSPASGKRKKERV